MNQIHMFLAQQLWSEWQNIPDPKAKMKVKDPLAQMATTTATGMFKHIQIYCWPNSISWM